jgi:hypothetical protein
MLEGSYNIYSARAWVMLKQTDAFNLQLSKEKNYIGYTCEAYHQFYEIQRVRKEPHLRYYNSLKLQSNQSTFFIISRQDLYTPWYGH